MNRRTVLASSVMAGLFGMGRTARAAAIPLGIQPTIYGPVPVFRALVQHPARILQTCPQTCWAASCAMIFTMLGRPTDQMQIVNKVMGGPVCAPAPNGITMASVLSSDWVDTNGGHFLSSLTAAYDIRAGITAINNAIVVNELTSNRPLLYANSHHAMVVVSADYMQTPAGPIIQSASVIDPFPAAPGFHALTPNELLPAHLGGEMNFLASVMVY